MAPAPRSRWTGAAATSRPAANILSYFWDLAAVGAGKRATAATALIEALEAAQQAFVAGGGGADADGLQRRAP